MTSRKRVRPAPARRILPSLYSLETRALLAGPSASWIGQDGQDLVGPYAAEQADGIQDIRVKIDGLDPARPILAAQLLGLGGSAWVYNLALGHWRAALVNAVDGRSADLYVQPDRVETGRPFNLVLTLGDGSIADLWFDGGTADPGLRMADASLQAVWKGQRGVDQTGVTAAVGPDGVQDAEVEILGLAKNTAVAAIQMDGPPGSQWTFGLNPLGRANAEFERDTTDASRGVVYFSPNQDLKGDSIKIQVVYDTGRVDTTTLVAGATDPYLSVPAPSAIPARLADFTVGWQGQSTNPALADETTAGWVGLELGQLPSARTIVGATLSNAMTRAWTYRKESAGPQAHYSDPYTEPLRLLRDPADASRGWAAFPPVRDERGGVLSLRLTFEDGSYAIAEFAGGSSDLSRLAATPAATSVAAAPGSDLQALARQFGSIELLPGVHKMNAPLVLDQPVRIFARQAGATLLFEQPDGAMPWTAAIKVRAGNTTLSGFALRFAGPVRWNWGVSYGPALIGVTDNLDVPRAGRMVNLTFRDLDMEAPLPATSNANEESPRALRLAGAAGGLVTNNRIRGGTVEFLRGPWTITNNVYLGTRPGSWAWDVFAGHETYDLVLTDNLIQPAADAGVTFRFLVLTGSGDGGLVARNQVGGLGARDAASRAINAQEMLLTEAYSTRFEGRPLSLSAGGRLLRIPSPQGETPSTGNVVAVVSGGGAGAWARIGQVITPTLYWLDRPLPETTDAVAILPGFVDDRFDSNIIDARGTSATGMVLLGGMFGSEVVGNTVLGGSVGIRMTSYPTEKPRLWGWSHTPVFDADLVENTVIDAQTGFVVGVERGSASKSSKGRVYQSLRLERNVVRWSEDFDASEAPLAILMGDPRSLDPAETRVQLGANFGTAPPGGGAAARIRVVAARVNDQDLVDTFIPLAEAAPWRAPIVRLANDTGASRADFLTNDSRLVIEPQDGVIGFEYTTGAGGSWAVLKSAGSFAPRGLVEGGNVVTVRALYPGAIAGPETSVALRLDTRPPSLVLGVTATTDGKISHRVSPDVWRYEYRVRDEPYRVVETAGAFVPKGLWFGQNLVELRAVDFAGNAGPGRKWVVNRIPKQPQGLWIGQDNRDFTGPYPWAVADGIQDIRIQIGGLPGNKLLTFVDVQGKGGSRWQFGGANGHWKIVVVRAQGSTIADLYMQPDRVENGREFEVRLRFNDGSSAHFYMDGGAADPTLKVRPVPAAVARPLPARPEGITAMTPRVARWLKAWRIRQRR